jgi:glycosyltransferase involved in cell wall biosynthesis
MNKSDDMIDVDEMIMHTIQNWSTNRFENGKSIKDILKYKKFTLCFFFDSNFELDLCDKVRKYITTKTKTNQKRNIKSFVPTFLIRFCILAKVVVLFLFGKLSELLCNKKSNSTDVLFMTYHRLWNDTTNPLLKHKKTDSMIGDVLMDIKDNNFTTLAFSYDTSTFINFKTMFDQMLITKGLWKPIETYLTLDVIKTTYNICKIYDNEWSKLRSNHNFKRSIQYNGSALFDLLKHDFNILFKYRVFTAILYIELVKRAIEATNPKTIVIICEYCIFGRAAVIAGKIKGIPTLAIQHGIITPTHPGCIFNKEDKDKIILPDLTCVYGQYHYDLLTKDSIYEPDQVIVTGQPRYDILYNIDKTYSKKRFLEKYGINPEHKIVLWTTQSHGMSDEENAKNLVAMFKAMQNLKNTTLILKQHPGERKKDTKQIKQYLNAYKINALLMDKKSNTYEQIFVCDLVITKNSTTAMEAVALNKPVIVLNLGGAPDVVDYVELGVALGVYRGEDLKPAIENLLKGDTDLAKNRNKYIEKYLYKIDGKATERVVKLVEEIIRKRRKQNVNL